MRKDSNQDELVKEFRKWFPTASVHIASNHGEGFPDLVVGFEGRTFLFEVKDPEKTPSQRKLTEKQERFHGQWKGHCEVVHSATEMAAKIAIFFASGK